MVIVVCLYICLCIHEQMLKNGAFMKLQFILIVFIVKCIIWGMFRGVYLSFIMSQLIIHNS